MMILSNCNDSNCISNALKSYFEYKAAFLKRENNSVKYISIFHLKPITSLSATDGVFHYFNSKNSLRNCKTALVRISKEDKMSIPLMHFIIL